MNPGPTVMNPILSKFSFGLILLASVVFLHASDALPDYQPQMKVTGVLRSRGNDQMAGLLKRWQTGFKRFHPEVQFVDRITGSAGGIYGLDLHVADYALLGRPIFPYERYGTYEHSWLYPVSIEVATGSADALHKSPAYAIFVHKDNPLAQVTVRELDGIFGVERAGGWNALTWDTSVARTAKDNIRTWGQLGVKGPLGDRPIHVYGPPGLGAGAITFFQARVFGGGEMWNEGLREYADRAQMMAELSRDPSGIAYAPIAYATPGVKALALAETNAGPYVPLNRATVTDRSYPLHRPVYLYYTIDNERCDLSPTRGDPRVKEFLRYILSKQGQADVAAEGSYLPLPAATAAEQLKKVDATGTPPEKLLLED